MGAEIRGIDLGAPLDDVRFAAVHEAFLAHGAIFFREQTLTPEAQIAFAKRFGEPEVHPIVVGTEDHPEILLVRKPPGESASFGTGWHTDNTFFEHPSLGTVLYGVEIPPYGGDTLFASMTRAYDALSQPMQAFLGERAAVHSASRAYDPKVTGEAKYKGEGPMTYRYSEIVEKEVVHPVVRTHPETGRKSLFVNPMFTLRIEGLEPGESQALLHFLYAHATQPEFTCRFRWEPGSVALWDNRCVQHYAMDDYQEFERVMMRVTITGDRPF
jgi:taurine dioxygenase